MGVTSPAFLAGIFCFSEGKGSDKRASPLSCSLLSSSFSGLIWCDLGLPWKMLPCTLAQPHCPGRPIAQL